MEDGREILGTSLFQKSDLRMCDVTVAILTKNTWTGWVLNVTYHVACVASRFCRAGRRSGVAAKFAREARENERRSREKNKNRLPGFVAFSTAAPFNSF